MRPHFRFNRRHINTFLIEDSYYTITVPALRHFRDIRPMEDTRKHVGPPLSYIDARRCLLPRRMCATAMATATCRSLRFSLEKVPQHFTSVISML